MTWVARWMTSPEPPCFLNALSDRMAWKTRSTDSCSIMIQQATANNVYLCSVTVTAQSTFQADAWHRELFEFGRSSFSWRGVANAQGGPSTHFWAAVQGRHPCRGGQNPFSPLSPCVPSTALKHGRSASNGRGLQRTWYSIGSRFSPPGSAMRRRYATRQ